MPGFQVYSLVRELDPIYVATKSSHAATKDSVCHKEH